MCDLVPKSPLAKLVFFVLALGVAGGFSPSIAHAGSGVQPANGATTSEEPTFLVSLDQYDSLASVHVSTSTEMTSTGCASRRRRVLLADDSFGRTEYVHVRAFDLQLHRLVEAGSRDVLLVGFVPAERSG